MRKRFQLKETIATLIADEEKYIDAAIESIKYHRKQLEKYISIDPFFKITLEPYECEEKAPEIVKLMCEAARKASVGPMAAVAGTIAELAVKAMIAKGASHAIVENGGDIAMINDREIVIGIYTGESPIKNIGFLIEPRREPMGICTSSGKVGPSISFGNADAATVIARSASLADACATALGNEVKDESSVKKAFDSIKEVEGVEGALLIINNTLAAWGKIPKIKKVLITPNCITGR
jgi:ApbE superfamily uncharacterized protein (UPF0280 family)